MEGVADVLSNWEQIKMKEGRKTSALQGVPAQLPSLLRAYRMQEKAAGVGFDFPERAGAWEKVEEEIREFREVADSGTSDEAKEREFGDLLFLNYRGEIRFLAEIGEFVAVAGVFRELDLVIAHSSTTGDGRNLLFLNDGEARQLSGEHNIVKAARAISPRSDS